MKPGTGTIRSLIVVAALGGTARGQGFSSEEIMLRETKRLEWTVGTWEGTRMDGADSSRAAMTMVVSTILNGRGYRQEIEVRMGDGDPYSGFAVDVYDPGAKQWVREYVNATTGRFSHIVGESEGKKMVWSSASPERKRESRMVSEQVGIGQSKWRRTMHVSEDDGKTWHVLWQDNLRRK